VHATRAAGVTVLEAAALTELKSLDTAVEATLDDGRSITAPFAIAADGAVAVGSLLSVSAVSGFVPV